MHSVLGRVYFDGMGKSSAPSNSRLGSIQRLLCRLPRRWPTSLAGDCYFSAATCEFYFSLGDGRELISNRFSGDVGFDPVNSLRFPGTETSQLRQKASD